MIGDSKITWKIEPIPQETLEHAQKHWQTLAKPPGSLGQLEQLGTRISVIQQEMPPKSCDTRLIIFAGNHGVAADEGVSPYPQSVTAAMVETFLSGKAAVSILAEHSNSRLEVVDCGVVGLDLRECQQRENNTTNLVIAIEKPCQTGNIACESAMSREELNFWLDIGSSAADRAASAHMVALGEMGIGNTTPASALTAKLLRKDPLAVVGPGTGLTASGVAHKTSVVARSLERSGADPAAPLEVLRDLGGFEIAALVGCMLRLAELRVPILLDGFICSAAALVACSVDQNLRDYLIPTTVSAEPGHQHILDFLNLEAPIFDLGLRLGEGSGAALAIPVAQSACLLMERMATLESVIG